MADIHVGDVGTAFQPTIRDEDGKIVPTAGASILEMIFRKPNGIVLVKTATVFEDGTAGKIQYITIDGDIDIKGVWQVQGYIEINGGGWSSNVHTFEVLANIRR